MQPSGIKNLIILPVKLLKSIGRISEFVLGTQKPLPHTKQTNTTQRELERVRERVWTCGRQKEKLDFSIKKKKLRIIYLHRLYVYLLNINYQLRKLQGKYQGIMKSK